MFRFRGIVVAKAGFPGGHVAHTRFTTFSFSPQGVCRKRWRFQSHRAGIVVSTAGPHSWAYDTHVVHHVLIRTQDVASNDVSIQRHRCRQGRFSRRACRTHAFTTFSFSPHGVCRKRWRFQSRRACPCWSVCWACRARMAHPLLICFAGCCVAHSVDPRGIVVATARPPSWAYVTHVFATFLFVPQELPRT
jgi:hypothetical protein